MDQRFIFLPEVGGTKLYFASMSKNPVIKYHFNVGKTKESKELVLAEFIEVKGWKAMGNKLIDAKLTKVELIQADETSLEVDTEAEAPAEDIIDTSSVPKKELKLPSETKDPGKNKILIRKKIKIPENQA